MKKMIPKNEEMRARLIYFEKRRMDAAAKRRPLAVFMDEVLDAVAIARATGRLGLAQEIRVFADKGEFGTAAKAALAARGL